MTPYNYTAGIIQISLLWNKPPKWTITGGHLDKKLFFMDNLHLIKAGHDLLARKLANVITRCLSSEPPRKTIILECPPSQPCFPTLPQPCQYHHQPPQSPSHIPPINNRHRRHHHRHRHRHCQKSKSAQNSTPSKPSSKSKPLKPKTSPLSNSSTPTTERKSRKRTKFWPKHPLFYIFSFVFVYMFLGGGHVFTGDIIIKTDSAQQYDTTEFNYYEKKNKYTGITIA